MSFAMKYALFFTALAFAADTHFGELVILYSALYLAVFLYIQQRIGGFAYVIEPSAITFNPATGLPMQQSSDMCGYEVGGHAYGSSD